MCTLIYAANRTEVKELTDVSKQLQKKYGKDFADIARSNSDNSVNERVVHKLSAQPPNAFLVLNYMKVRLGGVDTCICVCVYMRIYRHRCAILLAVLSYRLPIP